MPVPCRDGLIEGVDVYSLLHCHFESALRALALVKPNRLQYLRSVRKSPAYREATSAGRLDLLCQTASNLTNDEDLFTEAVFRRIVQHLLDEMRTSNVEHIDLRIGPTAGRWQWMRSTVDGLTLFREELGRYNDLSVAFLAAVNMTKSESQLDTIFNVLLDSDMAGRLAGLDINLLPGDLPKFDRYLGVVHFVQRAGLRINVHLGELFDNEVSRYVLSRITPDRVGHGVLLLHDPTLVDIIRSQGICLDMCPTSNTMLGVVDWSRENPARRALQLGVPVSINTDDPILFGTNIEREIRLAGLVEEELDAVVASGRKYRYGR